MSNNSDFWRAPTCVTLNVHQIDEIRADASTAVQGALHIHAFNDGYETFEVTAFTGDAALADDLAKAICEVAAKHRALKEGLELPAEEAIAVSVDSTTPGAP